MIKWFFFLVCVVLLSACETYTSKDEVKDSGPEKPLNVNHIPDAVPMVEPRTRAGNSSPYTVLGQPYTVMTNPAGYVQSGIASWYGNKFHNEKTANGELYNMYGMTAAHKSLPIPSYVRVTNLNNDRAVIVRVNDRGPFHGGRIIDLTYTAAKKLGFADQGTAEVKVEYIDPLKWDHKKKSFTVNADPNAARAPAPKFSGGFELPENTYIQVGAFSELASADSLKAELTQLTLYPIHVLFPQINEGPSRSPLFKVQIGPFDNNADLQRLRQKLLEKNYPLPHVVYRTDKVNSTR